jgi:hypothetical protein
VKTGGSHGRALAQSGLIYDDDDDDGDDDDDDDDGDDIWYL